MLGAGDGVGDCQRWCRSCEDEKTVGGIIEYVHDFRVQTGHVTKRNGWQDEGESEGVTKEIDSKKLTSSKTRIRTACERQEIEEGGVGVADGAEIRVRGQVSVDR